MIMVKKDDTRLNPVIHTKEKEIIVLSRLSALSFYSDLTAEQRKKCGWICVGPSEICGWITK